MAAIHAALDAGINWIDTAAVYGLGHSEEVVSRALQGRANRPYVFTKCSMVWDKTGQIGHSLKAESVRRECEASLRRLKGGKHGRTPGEVAIAWTLHNSAVTAAIVGVRSPQQVQGIIGAGDLQLSVREVAVLQDVLGEELAALASETLAHSSITETRPES